MENATDALKMAAAVLVFVLALSISINAFGEARQSVTTILQYRDSQYDIETEYGHIQESGTSRIVGAESIVPAIYKAYLENYKVVFTNAGGLLDKGLFQVKDSAGEMINIYEIDLNSENQNIGNDTRKMQFIQAILYGTSDSNIINYFQVNSRIYLNTQGIYDTIVGKRFYEKLGVYYPDEITTNDEGEIVLTEDPEADVPDANKETKRVITYELVS